MITYICRIVFHCHGCAAYLYPSVDDVAVPNSLCRPYLFDSNIFLKKQKTERLFIEVVDRQSAVSRSSTSVSFIKTKTIGVTGKSFNLKKRYLLFWGFCWLFPEVVCLHRRLLIK
jgi:hypothetical protein